MSGIKGRSGRRPDAEIRTCRKLIDEAVAEQDWKIIFQRLIEKAKDQSVSSGTIQAIELLMKYRFGVPTQYLEADMDALPAVAIINVLPPGQTNPSLESDGLEPSVPAQIPAPGSDDRPDLPFQEQETTPGEP